MWLFLFFLSLNSFSQVVNIEKKRTANSKDGLQGNVDFSLNIMENNNSIIQGKNTVKLQYYKGKNLFLFFNDITLTRVNNNRYQNDGYQHLRYNYSFSKGPFVAEAFAQHQYNTVRKIKQRVVSGLGPRIRIVEKDTFRLFFGPLSMFEYQALTTDSITMKARMSCYVSVGWNFSKWLAINDITYYQPNYADFSDYKVATEASLLIRITDKLSLKSMLELSYESKPPPGVKNLFYSLSNGLSFFF